MTRAVLLYLFLFLQAGMTAAPVLPGNYAGNPDSLTDYQTLYNGRPWHNNHPGVAGDPFLFTREYLEGSVSIGGKTFTGLKLKVDLFSDDLLTPFGTEGMLRLNREMVDSFEFVYANKRYRFVRLPDDSTAILTGYAEVLYSGKTALYRKFTKKIDRPGVENSGDRYYQFSQTYLLHNSIVIPVKSRRDLFKIFAEDKVRLRDYLRQNHLRVIRKNPESFVPLLQVADRISH
jgi:hypothetical protein